MPIGASRMTHHRTFWTTASSDVDEDKERLGLFADLQRGDTDGDGDDDDLQHVEVEGVSLDPVGDSSTACRPKTLPGTRPWRKSSHDPVVGSVAAPRRAPR